MFDKETSRKMLLVIYLIMPTVFFANSGSSASGSDSCGRDDSGSY